MRNYAFALVGSVLLACTAYGQAPQSAAPTTTNSAPNGTFKDDKEKISYAIGMSMGTQWKRMDIDVDINSVTKGIKDSVGGGSTLISEQDMQDTLRKFTMELRAKREEKMKAAAEENKKKGEAFLASNKTKPGVITLPSGLQYQILTEGSGESPKPEDTVSVNYKGTLIDGTEFDNSAKHGQAFTTRVGGGVIKGWTEALQLMKPGSKWRIWVPAELAYGDRQMGPSIAPGSTLIFDMELLSVTKGVAAAPAAPLTSDIIKVPSAEELKKGAKIETIKPEDLEKEKAKASASANK